MTSTKSNFKRGGMWLIVNLLLTGFGLLLMISTTYLTGITLGGLLIGLGSVSAVVFLINLVIGIVLISLISYLYHKYSWLLVVWLCIATLVILLMLDMTNGFGNFIQRTQEGLWAILSGLVFGVLFSSTINLFSYVIENSTGEVSAHSQRSNVVIGCIVGILSGVILTQSFSNLWGLASAITIITITFLTVDR